MLSYTHFTHDERISLHNFLKDGLGIREIARRLGRSPSTISREIKRNSSSKGYHHWRAQILTICRRRYQRQTALKPGTPQYDYTLEKLHRMWPPEAIANRFRLEHPGQVLSTSTIYRAIHRGTFPGISARENLRRRGKNRNYVHHNTAISPTRLITEWPDAIKARARLGDFEGDTVYGGIGKGLLVTLVDRRSRFLLAGKLSSRNAAETREVMQQLLSGHTVRSISLDNGTEFAEFRLLEEHIGGPRSTLPTKAIRSRTLTAPSTTTSLQAMQPISSTVIPTIPSAHTRASRERSLSRCCTICAASPTVRITVILRSRMSQYKQCLQGCGALGISQRYRLRLPGRNLPPECHGNARRRR